jgi:hypothetical protein
MVKINETELKLKFLERLGLLYSNELCFKLADLRTKLADTLRKASKIYTPNKSVRLKQRWYDIYTSFWKWGFSSWM